MLQSEASTQLTGFSGLTIEEGGATGMEAEPMVTLESSFRPGRERALVTVQTGRAVGGAHLAPLTEAC